MKIEFIIILFLCSFFVQNQIDLILIWRNTLKSICIVTFSIINMSWNLFINQSINQFKSRSRVFATITPPIQFDSSEIVYFVIEIIKIMDFSWFVIVTQEKHYFQLEQNRQAEAANVFFLVKKKISILLC